MIHSTMGVWTAGDDSPNPLDHSWWYCPLDLVGRAPKARGSDAAINNLNTWLVKYKAESRPFVQKFLWLPNDSNEIPVYYGKDTDSLVDWDTGGATLMLHTPADAPKPGSTGVGTRNGHLILYDGNFVMGTGYDGWRAELFDLRTKGIQGGIFDGSPQNDGSRGRSSWAKELLRAEFDQTGEFAHRFGMGWPDGDKQTFKVGTWPKAARTAQFAWPLTGNDASSGHTGPIYAIEGAVFRIKPEVDLSKFSWSDPIAHAVARAMQTYGAVVIDGEGPYTGGPIIDQYSGDPQEVVKHVPITPTNYEWVKPGYDPRNGSMR